MNKNFFQRSLLARFGAVLAGVIMANAVGAADGGSSDAAVNEEGQIEEIVVTATRRDQDLQEVPLSITALSGEALDDYRLSLIHI